MKVYVLRFSMNWKLKDGLCSESWIINKAVSLQCGSIWECFPNVLGKANETSKEHSNFTSNVSIIN